MDDHSSDPVLLSPKSLKWPMMLLSSLWLAFASAGTGIPEPPMNLKQAIQYAVQHSPKIDSSLKAQDSRELEFKSAVARFFPSLNLAGSAGLQNNFYLNGSQTLLAPNSSAPWFSSMSLALTETLYDNGVSLAQYRIADRSRQVAELESLKARADLTLAVATEYYNYSLSEALLGVKKQQLQILEKQFDMLSTLYKQGLKPRLDFLRFKAQVQRAVLDQATAERALETSAAYLKQLLGGDFLNDSLTLRFASLGVDVKNESVKKLHLNFSNKPPSIRDFYDSKSAQIQKQINEESVSQAIRQFWPQITVTGSVAYSNLSFLNSSVPFGTTGQLSYSALVGLQFNLWDWGTRSRDIRLAELARDQKLNNLNLGLLEVRNKIDTLMIDISRIQATYVLNLELLASEEENYRNIEVQYREGKVNYLDLITSLGNVLGARTQFYSAYFEALQILAKYHYYEGSIYEKFAQSEAP